MSSGNKYPVLSVGVVTYERSAAFNKMLGYMKQALESYPVRCEFIIANNSGPTAYPLVASSVSDSGIKDVCDCQVVNSPENSISVGRNVVLEHASHDLLAFIDDDEYPVESWLVELVDAMNNHHFDMVAGPIIPVFQDSAPTWIKSLDLHNTVGKHTGGRLDYAATGNVLINRQSVSDVRFDNSFGKSGGEDTEFFLRLKDRGLSLCWSAEAIVEEDIPAEKATTAYMIRRFMTQGRNYRTILEQRREIQYPVIFTLRAALLAVAGLSIGVVLLVIRPGNAGKWLKRGFSNLGKIIDLQNRLYE